MKVSSPIGELPFRLERVRPDRHGITMTGRMGAWPARVTIDRSDALDMARIAAPVLVPLAILGVISAMRRFLTR